MLKLINIKKDYFVADSVVHALKGININFRENEFVAVLGQSGCGKTTLLNLIGGLDQATGGDLLIWGKSTKKYKDRDWDIYRNHRVGFIFQSYNLIPHQTVLGNVELALTIAGLDKETRVAKAKLALDKVGLNDQYYKKPNQLSGGQSQRVAIARALVNDPEILLADEPTGALDTTTSKQIMDLIKEIAKDRLVIMVTHNPLLAEEYSTRVIRFLDGELISDSSPFTNEEEEKATKEALTRRLEQIKKKPVKKSNEKAKMTFWTAFKLSIQNIFTKKRRTALTALAGSIGIIGVSLVLSVSIGLQSFIDDMQNDMLAGNPISINQTTFDINVMVDFTKEEQKEIIEKGNYVNVNSMIAELTQRLKSKDEIMVENKINQNYIEFINDMPQNYWSALFYDYGLDISNSLYTKFFYPTQEEGRETSLSGIQAAYTSVLKQVNGFEEFATLIGTLSNPFKQALDTKNPVTEEYILSQYNVLYKRDSTNGIAKEANEIMVVLDKNRMISDLTLGQIGYYSQTEFINIINKAIGSEFDHSIYDNGQVDYDALASIAYTWYPNDVIFSANPLNPTNPYTYHPYADSTWTDGLPLVVVGILEPKDELNYGVLTSGLYYTTALAKTVIENNYNSQIANYLREVEKKDSLLGTAVILPKGSLINPSLPPLTEDYVQVINGKVIDYTYEYIFKDMPSPEKVKAVVNSSQSMLNLMSAFMGATNEVAVVSVSLQSLGANVGATISKDEDGNILTWTINYDEDGAIFTLPSSVAIYPPNFVQKDKVLHYLDQWNASELITLSNGQIINATEREKIVYTDVLSLIMSMISNLLTLITIALIGFTSLALVVSCVMIAIITYVSVVERIKEIGVIRSLGGSKGDVANLFIAETFIIGLISGLIGIIVTYLLSWILNLIVRGENITRLAFFPWWVALIMLGISIGLTLISGLLPSNSAAKKDPVVALRTE